MPTKIPRKTAAAARPGSRLSFSKAAANCRTRVWKLPITLWPLPSPAWSLACISRVCTATVRPSGRYHRQLAARNHLPIHPDRAADVRHPPSLGHLFRFNAQFLPRSHGLEKLEPVYGPEQRHSCSRSGVRLRSGRSQHHSRGLGHRFNQKNARQDGLGGKMSRKNRVRRIDELHGNTTNSRLQFLHPVDPQERSAMRNHGLDFTSPDHPSLDHGLYTSNVFAGIFGFSELTSTTNTLFTPLFPSTSSDRSRKFPLSSFTTRQFSLRRKLSVRGTSFISKSPLSSFTVMVKFFLRFPMELSRLK